MLITDSVCETGLVRSRNQDCCFAEKHGHRGLFAVADGMGGHYDGAVASHAVRDALSDWWNSRLTLPPCNPLQASEELRSLLMRCNRHIRQCVPEGEVCGTTLVLLYVDGSEYLLVSVGDSRCYRIQAAFWGSRMEQLTTDDVWRPETASSPANVGKLRHALGAEEPCFLTFQQGKLEKKTLFALCTDGIYRFCPVGSLRQILCRSFSGENLAEGITETERCVLRHGAPDNYSLVLVRYTPQHTGCSSRFGHRSGKLFPTGFAF